MSREECVQILHIQILPQILHVTALGIHIFFSICGSSFYFVPAHYAHARAMEGQEIHRQPTGLGGGKETCFNVFKSPLPEGLFSVASSDSPGNHYLGWMEIKDM